MDTDLFLQQFGHLAQGEGGIKKLRDVILQLAVRGKLVEQNPADEPAEVLLKKIRAERKSKEKPSKVVVDFVVQLNELGFQLPNGWCFDRVINLIKMTKGKKPQNLQSSKTIYPYVNIKAFDHGIIDEWTDDDTAPQCAEGDLLIVCDGSRSGYTGFAIAGVLGSTLAKIELYAGIEQKFFKIFTDANFRKFNTAMKGAAIPHLDLPMFRSHPFPLPPLAEQKRIVAKVDELMALCDKLEAEQKAQAALKTQAVQSTLHHLTSAESPASFGTSINILERTFGNWFDDLANVKHLRATILQLAVQGKLVPQNPTDEPASDLLKRIEIVKERLVKEGKIKLPKPLSALDESTQPFDIPRNWSWTRFGTLVEHSEAGWSPKCEDSPRINDNWGVLKVSAVSWGKFKPEENKALPANLEPRPEYEVMSGDMLISRANTAELVAKSVIVEGCPPHLMMSDKIIRLRITPLVDLRYCNLVNASGTSRSYYADVAGGTSASMKNVSREQILSLAVPLPPLAEQKRIVAKVDELMTLCDQLEAHIIHTQTLNTYLMDSLIHRMTEAA